MDESFGKSFAKAQQLHGISLSSFVASVSLSAVIFTLEVLVFLIIRKRFPDFYTTVPEHLDSNPKNWKRYIATNILRFDRRHEHFDRYFFRRYLRSLILIFTPASLLITPILVPLNYTNGKTAVLGVSGLDALGWSNVGLDQADRYWVHLVFSLLFTGHVCWVIWNELTFYVATRQHSPYAALCTVLIDSIPDDWMSEKVLTSQLEVFPGEITAISFNRDYSAISQLAASREGLARALEVAEISNIRKACRAGVQKRAKRSSIFRGPRHSSYQSRNLLNLFAWLRLEKVDTTMVYREELREAGEKMDFYRAAPEEFPLLRSAFITFASPLAAHIACQTVIHTSSGYMTPRTMPLSVDDVVWSNVNITWRDRTIRTVLSNVLIAATAIACVVPVALAGLLSQIIYITQAVSWLSWINELPESFLGLLQGVLPPILVTVLVKGFILILDYLVRKQGISSRSQIDLKIQDYYFYFLFVQVTLVVSLSAGLTAIANEMASGASLAATLAKNLPKASNYFISYILLQALSVSANSLLRMDRLFGKLILGPIFDKSVTQMMTRKKGQDLQWGTFVPVFTNLSCIGFLYAIISPIIIPFQVLAIGLFWIIFSSSSILLTERDHGGLFYPKALKHLLIGLYLMQVCLVALFLLVRDSQGNARCIGQACIMVLATGLTIVYHRLLCRAFNPLLSFSPTALKDALAKDATPSPIFLHKALRSSPAISIPKDGYGIGSARALQLREELKDVIISNSDATITEAGKLQLR
ncbi:RSN1-7TM multi-domain protein [Pyrenophora tritici-repentis]|nr:RSN1-7TM multi-domain protein [Pyrenophora tritici-repentis]